MWVSKSRDKWSASASIWTTTATWPVPNSLYIANCLFTHWKDIVGSVRAKASNLGDSPEILLSTGRVTSQGDYRTQERWQIIDKDHNLPPPKSHWQLQTYSPSNLDLLKWQLPTADCSNRFHSLSKQATSKCLTGSKYHSTFQWDTADRVERSLCLAKSTQFPGEEARCSFPQWKLPGLVIAQQEKQNWHYQSSFEDVSQSTPQFFIFKQSQRELRNETHNSLFMLEAKIHKFPPCLTAINES